MVCGYQNADCSLRKKILSFIKILSTLSFPITLCASHIIIFTTLHSQSVLNNIVKDSTYH